VEVILLNEGLSEVVNPDTSACAIANEDLKVAYETEANAFPAPVTTGTEAVRPLRVNPVKVGLLAVVSPDTAAWLSVAHAGAVPTPPEAR
jgi:hypothetical protein